MYVYWFNSRKGNEFLSAKVIESYEHFDKMQVIFDESSELAKRLNKCWLTVPIEEGKVGYRHFWLEEHDELKALDIVNAYEKSKWLNSLKPLNMINYFTSMIDYEKK